MDEQFFDQNPDHTPKPEISDRNEPEQGRQNLPDQNEAAPGWQNTPNQNEQNTGWQNTPNQNEQNTGWQNGYGQTPPPQQAPWQSGQPQNGPYSNPYYQNQQPNYQNQPNYPKQPQNSLAATSLGLGIISMLVSCCCFPIGFIVGFALGMGGLVTAIVSKKGQPFSGFAIAGLVISILGICLSLFIFGCYMLTAYMMKDPNYAAMINELMEQYQNGMTPQMIPFFLKNLF